jgi:hypothetical protein
VNKDGALIRAGQDDQSSTFNSNVETTFHMIKSKFGQRLRSRTLTAQINEALCKVLCHNLCVVIQSVHELGIEATFGAELQLPHNPRERFLNYAG